MCYDTSCIEEGERYGKDVYRGVDAQVVKLCHRKCMDNIGVRRCRVRLLCIVSRCR